MGSSQGPVTTLPAVNSAPALGRVAIIGAGVSGLAAAYRLQQEGVDVTVFESRDQAGGRLASRTSSGFLWDAGANTMMEDEPLVGTLLRELGLEDKIAVPMQQKNRYVVRNGKVHKLPTNLVEFLRTPLLSTPAKVRLLAEPFLWQRKGEETTHSRNSDLQLSKPAGVADAATTVAGGKDDPAEDAESVRSFLTRHIGQEPVDYLVDPFCAGTFASTPDRLAMKYAFPAIWQLEQEHGSLLLGAVKSQLQRARGNKASQQPSAVPPGLPAGNRPPERRRKGSFSFIGGMQTLPLALAARVGQAHLRLGTTVTALASDAQHHPRPIWTVSFAPTLVSPLEAAEPAEFGGSNAVRPAAAQGGSQTPAVSSAKGQQHHQHQQQQHGATSRTSGGKGKPESMAAASVPPAMRFDAVIVTAPLPSLQRMRLTAGGQPWDADSIPVPHYPSISLLVSAFPASAVKHPLSGFGVLLPAREAAEHHFNTLGTLFSSAMFPGRAPQGFHLFTTFVGGGRRPDLAALPSQKLQQLMMEDLERLVGVEGPPMFFRHVKWGRAFPEYGPAYGNVLQGLRELEQKHPFFYYAGNHRGGLAVGRALLSGYKMGGKVASDLRAHGGAHLYTMA